MELFKKDSKGKVRSWKTWTEGSILIQEYGLLDGKKVLDSKESKPKNIGKSNETTGAEQAILEMESKIKSKLDEGYFETIDEALNNEVILPMLAKDFKKESKNIDWTNAFEEPKFDGMRCLAVINNNSVKLLSRAGLEITTLGHINEALSIISKSIDNTIILDGEIYSMELGGFQDQMKAVKKYREGITEKLNFNVYDIINDASFHVRNNMIKWVFDEYKFDIDSPIKRVERYKTSKEEFPKYHKQFIEEGFEGTMVRWGDEGYKMDARSKNLLKYKDFIDIVAEVIDVIPSDARPTQGIVVCRLDNGGEFKATPKMSHEDREELLTNKHEYIGQKAEIRFFEYTDDGLPRFPVCHGFRLDK
jgi:DNA ligase-1